MTGASANGDGLLDLEAASAAAATEAEGRPFTFAYKGARYEVPAMAGWELRRSARLPSATSRAPSAT